MTVAFYGFQHVPDVRVVTSEKGWGGWFDEYAGPLNDAGVLDHHLHNPFGLHTVPGRDRVMHIDQFELSYCQRLEWLANRSAFGSVVRRVHDGGGVVQAYVGSPLQIARSPQPSYLTGCSPAANRLSSRLRWVDRFGGCRLPPWLGRCMCWRQLVRFHIEPLLEAGVDAIGFDDSSNFTSGSCMDQLVRWIMSERMEVMIEDWPWVGRAYPAVSWVIRELRYHQIRLGLVDAKAEVTSVPGKIYRIVPADTDVGRDEFDDINDLKSANSETPYGSFQEVIDVVREDGHTPLIRARQLITGDLV
jgi:hypothetical protein